MGRFSLDPTGTLRSGLSRTELSIRRLGSAVIDRYPVLWTPAMQLWSGYVQAYGAYQARATAVRGDHRAPIEPFAVVSADPSRIDFLVEADGYPHQTRSEVVFPQPKFKHAGRVVAGDWDDHELRFEETDLYRGFEARFERDVPWQETEFYRSAVKHIEDGIELWGCSSERDFERRCEFIESLYDSIAEEGYRSQSELTGGAFDLSGDDPRSLGIVTDEITVCVGRDGDLLFTDGRNRMAIAKLLDLDRVPVWIMVRHEEWQRTRDRLATDPSRWRECPERLRDHPDLEGLRPDPNEIGDRLYR